MFRNILVRIIFNDEYENIDKNLTDSNVGGRKGRGIRDNLFVINAIINSMKNGGEDACDIQMFDVETLPTDPRVEFISQDHSSQFTNLEHIAILESRLSINFQPNISILTKSKVKILTKPRFRILTKI